MDGEQDGAETDQQQSQIPQTQSDVIKWLIKKQRLDQGEDAPGHPRYPSLKDIILVDQADVEIIKINFMGMMIDISIGQHGGLCTMDFMNYFDQKVIGQNHLLKRSIMLLKSWFTYESSLLGSQLACMATYGLYTLVIYVFTNYGKATCDGAGGLEIKTEWEVFKKFFEIFDNFDWDKYMITIFGPIRI